MAAWAGAALAAPVSTGRPLIPFGRAYCDTPADSMAGPLQTWLGAGDDAAGTGSCHEGHMRNAALRPYADVVYFGTLVLAALSLYAFYPGYLARLGGPISWIVHVHGVLMVAWIGLALRQAALVRRGRFDLHRRTGRFSYVLVPLLLLTALGMIDYGYERGLAGLQRAVDAGRLALSPEEVLHEARKLVALPVFYFSGFVLLYPLAMINRRRPLAHAQFMLATALMLTGPILDRCLYIFAERWFTRPPIPFEIVAFALMDLIFLAVFWRSLRRGESWRPAATCLAFFLAGQAVVLFGTGSPTWQTLAGWFL